SVSTPRRSTARDPQIAQIVGRNDVLRMAPGREMPDHTQARRIDDDDVSGLYVRHVDARRQPANGRTETAGAGLAVEVFAMDDRRHAGQRRGLERAPQEYRRNRDDKRGSGKGEQRKQAARHAGLKRGRRPKASIQRGVALKMV